MLRHKGLPQGPAPGAVARVKEGLPIAT